MGETWRGNDDFRPAAVFLVRLAATASEQGRGGGATDARAKRREARNLPEAGSRGVLWADGAPGAGLAARPQSEAKGVEPPSAASGAAVQDNRGGPGRVEPARQSGGLGQIAEAHTSPERCRAGGENVFQTSEDRKSPGKDRFPGIDKAGRG